MKKKVLACDLDNTLIYSYKHRVPGDSCVEWLNGEEQSFMTAETQALLPQAVAAVQLVPVTTRSLEQYRRLVWPQGSPDWAVTTNGGLLLCGGEPDVNWCDYSRSLAAGYQAALQKLAQRLDFAGLVRHRLVDDIYLYVVCSDLAAAQKCAADFGALAESAGLQVRRGGRKVYFLPPEIDKGAAVQRLRGLLPGAEIIAAGDSEMDLPMLNLADFALLPNETLAGQVNCKQKYVCPPGEHFAEFVLKMALELAEK